MSTPPEQSLGDDLRAWAERLVEPNLRPGESLQDFMAGAIHLAEKRARLHGRSRSTSLDLLFQLLCWDLCRFFPPSREKFEEELGRIRQDVFAGAATGNLNAWRHVPDSTLLLPIETLYTVQENSDIDGFLRVP
jgi:hypothetical protein